MVQPVKPEEIAARKAEVLPPFVLAAFNKLITLNYDGGEAVVYQDDVLDAIVALGGDDATRARALKEGWLNVESVYEAAGWKVVYDKPAYNESYRANFTFTAKNCK